MTVEVRLRSKSLLCLDKSKDFDTERGFQRRCGEGKGDSTKAG